MAVPVNLVGGFIPLASDAPSECTISETGIAARCRVGAGRVTLLADAALLDGEEDSELPRRQAVLEQLVDQSLAR